MWRIHYFHIAHDALRPATFCINIVFNFSLLLHSPLTIFSFIFGEGGEGGGVETWYSVGNEKMLNETNRCKTQETSRILITHLLRTVPDLVNTYLLSMTALCTSISIF